MKSKKPGIQLSKIEMKAIAGGYPPCEPPVCSGVQCPNCRYHCEWVNPLETTCVANNQQPIE